MILSSMGKMMEFLAPSQVHVLNPVKPAKTKGSCDKVYSRYVAGYNPVHAHLHDGRIN